MARLNTVLADGYDGDVFERALAQSAGLGEICERLGRLLPHAQPLMHDIFCVLFKLNVVLCSKRDIAVAVRINLSVIESLLASTGLEALRRQTALDEEKSAAVAGMLGRRVMDALRREFRNSPAALAGAAEAALDQVLLDAKRAELAHLDTPEAAALPGKREMAKEIRNEVAALRARLRRHATRQRDAAKIAARIEGALEAGVERVTEDLDASSQHTRGLGIGAPGTVDVQRRLELGDRIMRSEKLKRLARLTGAMREVAFEYRRQRPNRSLQETHSVTLGDDLMRLLPSEVIGLRGSGATGIRRALHMDFLRRFAERGLLQYRIQTPAARGPMVICLDGSGSMHGSKELWGKAVALTLMEIARRERRRCLALIFSSGHEPFQVELLAARAGGARAQVREEEVLRFAEHFPGGGTDFEEPLALALSAVTEGRYRHGDIVFITDGHAAVSDALVQRIDALRRRHRFRIRAILVDVSDHERAAVTAFADKVHSVTELASDCVAGLFAEI